MPAGMMVDGDKTERAATGVLTTATPSTAGRLASLATLHTTVATNWKTAFNCFSALWPLVMR